MIFGRFREIIKREGEKPPSIVIFHIFTLREREGNCFYHFSNIQFFKYFKPTILSMVRVVTCNLTTNVSCTETPTIDLQISCFCSLELVKSYLR